MAYQASCTEGDSFMIQSADENEVVDGIKQHADEKHDMDLSDGDAREMVEETQTGS